MSAVAAQAADYLATAWKDGATVPALPDNLRPRSVAEAMAIQSSFIDRHGSCGWKVGAHPAGEGWCGAPLRGPSVSASPHRLTTAGASTMRIEVEVAVVLGRDLPADTDADGAMAAIGQLHLALELFRSHYVDPKQMQFSDVLADNMNNAGIVLGGGSALAGAGDVGALQISLERNGLPLGSASGGPDLKKIVSQLTWLAGYAEQLDAPLRAGSVILTGARIGPLSVAEAGEYVASSDLGTVELIVG